MRDLFERYFNIKISGSNKIEKIKCIWHNDGDPSLALNLETGNYHCYGCSRDGHIKELLPSYKYIEESEVDRLHAALLQEEPLQQWLLETKGFSRDTILKLKIGHTGNRFSFPVRDEDGRCINIKMYSSSSKPKYVSFGEGFGAPAFFPFPPKEPAIYLMEGEADTILARQLGLPAYCQTAGAGSWSDALTKHLVGRKVTLVYDTDNSGRKGATKVINAIKFVSVDIKNILLPLAQGMTDFSDWVLKDGGSLQSLKEIEDSCPLYAVSKMSVVVGNPVPMHLSQTAQSENAFKSIECRVVVAGIDQSPYLIPKSIIVECSAAAKSCATCPNNSGQRTYNFDWKEGSIIHLVDIPEEIKQMRMKKLIGVPSRCSCQIETSEFQNIEKLALYPKVDLSTHDVDTPHTQVLRKAYFLGSGIMTNHPYTVRGIPVPDPRDQGVALLLVEAEPIQHDDDEDCGTEDLQIWRVEDEQDQK